MLKKNILVFEEDRRILMLYKGALEKLAEGDVSQDNETGPCARGWKFGGIGRVGG